MVITPLEFDQLMAPLEPFGSPPHMAIAVSGGADSLALALLAHRWAESQRGKAVALTVDHRLREGSTEEAHQVKAWMETRGIECHILTWARQGDVPQTAIQATARKARYRLLGQWCTDHGINHLLVAHHAQDQLETFLIRLAKGSGLKGLTGIQAVVPTRFGRILRPLLTIEPARLRATLAHFNQPFLLDPSNENTDFTRVRWRQLLPSLAVEGITPNALQGTLALLNHAQRLIDQHISALLYRYVTFSPYGYAIVEKGVCQESPEAFEEVIKRLLAAVGVRAHPVRRQALRRAIDMMKASRSITLGGCQIISKPRGWWVVRELAAVQKDIFVQQPGSYLWDDRFTVEVSKETPCQIAALGEKGVHQARYSLKDQGIAIPHIVLKTLPALWQGDKVLDALPHFTFTPYDRLFAPA